MSLIVTYYLGFVALVATIWAIRHFYQRSHRLTGRDPKDVPAMLCEHYAAWSQADLQLAESLWRKFAASMGVDARHMRVSDRMGLDYEAPAPFCPAVQEIYEELVERFGKPEHPLITLDDVLRYHIEQTRGEKQPEHLRAQ